MIMKMEYYHILIPLTNHYQTVIIILYAYFIITVFDLYRIGIRDGILLRMAVFTYPSALTWIFPVKLIVIGLSFKYPLLLLLAVPLCLIKIVLFIFTTC